MKQQHLQGFRSRSESGAARPLADSSLLARLGTWYGLPPSFSRTLCRKAHHLAIRGRN